MTIPRLMAFNRFWERRAGKAKPSEIDGPPPGFTQGAPEWTRNG